MTLGREWIEAHVPQKNGMCLLDEVLSWDSEQVLCRSTTHHRADHPLRAHAQLGSACAIEYAAQAAAVHGALCETGSRGDSRHGLLASVRDVELAVVRLDTVAGDLLVHVRRIQSDARGALYTFEVSEQRTTQPSAPLARGRLSLWLDGALGADSA
jgi:predicted hotdog family 3-hydroxylacyl-ACP dehydratase